MRINSIIIPFFFCAILVFNSSLAVAQISNPDSIIISNSSYPFYPETISSIPEFRSPSVTESGTEIVIVITRDDKYQFIPVTVENGQPLNYKKGHWYAKGLQKKVDADDFPTLAATGLHSDDELKQTTTITGKHVDEITKIGRPDNYSGAGFMAEDEDIISVLSGDNDLVRKLGLTHPELAKTLFHIFNIIIVVKKDSERGNTAGLMYNGKKINLKFWGQKGWQESIFNDEILGYWEFEIGRTLTKQELKFLKEKYGGLSDNDFSDLIKRLSFIHTGEMVPFYIMRYGFYEGHSGYRADPVALSFIFGFKTIEEIENSLEGKLFETLTTHFTDNR